MSNMTLQRAFELGALAMRRKCAAICGTELEGLQEDLMTSGGLSERTRTAMKHQLAAIDEIEKVICTVTLGAAAYYGSYILGDSERAEIKTIFPDIDQSYRKRTSLSVEGGGE